MGVGAQAAPQVHEHNQSHTPMTPKGSANFPLVLPDVVPLEDRPMAELTQQLLLPSHKNELIGFIETEYQKYEQKLKSDTTDDQTEAEWVICAKWAYEHYWRLCREWLLLKNLSDEKLSHHFHENAFVPMTPISTPSTASETRQARVVARVMAGVVEEEDLVQIQKKVFEEWQDLQAAVGATPSSSLPSIFEGMLKAKYWSIVHSVVQSRNSRRCVNGSGVEQKGAFIPKLKPEHDADAQQIEDRLKWIHVLNSSDDVQVTQLLGTKWSAMVEGFAPVIQKQMPVEPAEEFVNETYWECVQEVAMAKKEGRDIATKSFRPIVPVEEGANASEVAQRKIWVSRLTSADEDVVSTFLLDAWERHKAALPAYVKTCVSSDPPLDFKNSEYWGCVKLAVEASESAAGGGVAASQEMSASDPSAVSGVEALLSASAFQVATPTPQSSPSYACSRDILEEKFVDGNGIYEGFIVWHDSQPRVVMASPSGLSTSPAKRFSNGETKVEKPVLDVMVSDLTGPIQFTLWGDYATRFLEEKARIEASDTHAKIIFRIQKFRIGNVQKNEWNGPILTSTKILHTRDSSEKTTGSEMGLSTSGSSPYLSGVRFQVPNGGACITNFAACKAKLAAPPFRATLSGIIVNVQPLLESQKGEAKKYFDLVDKSGSWIPCCAIGMNAMSRVIAENYEVVIYYASGRGQIGDSKGCVYLFKDSLAIPVGKLAGPTPVKRMPISLE